MPLRRRLALALAVAGALFTACSGELRYELVDAFPNLEFPSQPIDIRHAGDATNRLFVAQRGGVIRSFENRPDVERSETFLNIGTRIDTSATEMGLLSLAFDPEFATNGFFYVYYNARSTVNTRLSRFQVTPPNAPRADPDSETVVLAFEQPSSSHNGGQIVFDRDGNLLLSLGDGKTPGDPFDNGQDRTTLLGSIIRIDVRTLPYTIPRDNPYRGSSTGFLEEIYAYGFRNPWRMSIDPVTRTLWVSDAGQWTAEEVDIVVAGGNYGWDCREGARPYGGQYSDPGTPSPLCETATDLIDPVWSYGRDLGGVITGGRVYRGRRLPSLVGRYIYGDYGTGRIWALDWTGETARNELILDTDLHPSAFGVDADGELYIAHFERPRGSTGQKLYTLREVGG